MIWCFFPPLDLEQTFFSPKSRNIIQLSNSGKVSFEGPDRRYFIPQTGHAEACYTQ